VALLECNRTRLKGFDVARQGACVAVAAAAAAAAAASRSPLAELNPLQGGARSRVAGAGSKEELPACRPHAAPSSARTVRWVRAPTASRLLHRNRLVQAAWFRVLLRPVRSVSEAHGRSRMQATSVEQDPPAGRPDGVPCTLPSLAPASKRCRRAHLDGRDSSAHLPPSPSVVPLSARPPHEPHPSPAPATHTTPTAGVPTCRLEPLKAAAAADSAHTPMRTHVHTGASPAPSDCVLTPARTTTGSLNDTTPASGWRRRAHRSTVAAAALSPATELVTPGRVKPAAGVDVVPGTPCTAFDGSPAADARSPWSSLRRAAAPSPYNDEKGANRDVRIWHLVIENGP
jgi:hypothetical protein